MATLDAAASTPLVEVKALHKEYGSVCALQKLELNVNAGEFLTLLGPSGCGKTTLLRCIAGLETSTAGRILIDGRDVTRIPPERRPLNMVFQRYALFPHLNVFDNVAFGLRLKKVAKEERRGRVHKALELVHLPGYERRMPHQLSGGQAQRVALARALVNEPKVLLLDEPLAALDRKIRQFMQDELRDIHRRSGTTFIYVTHDQDEAMAMSDRIVLMRDGRIEQMAAPGEMYHHPSSQFAAGFIGDANVVTGRVDAGGHIAWQGVVVGTQPGASTGEERAVLLRPEALRVCADDPLSPAVAGEIVGSTYFGFYWLHHIRVGDDVLDVRDFRRWSDGPPTGACWINIDVDRAVVMADQPPTDRQEH